MDLLDVMRTTFACREFMDEPVPDAALYHILDAARFAPSGGNRQGWRVVVVRDGKVRECMAEFPSRRRLRQTDRHRRMRPRSSRDFCARFVAGDRH